MEILLPIITPITTEIGIRSFIPENVYLSEKNNFEIIILTISHSEESLTQFSKLRTTVQPTLAKIHGRKYLASGSAHPGLAYSLSYCLNMKIVPRMHREIVLL